jgi:hypothetical protein
MTVNAFMVMSLLFTSTAVSVLTLMDTAKQELFNQDLDCLQDLRRSGWTTSLQMYLFQT